MKLYQIPTSEYILVVYSDKKEKETEVAGRIVYPFNSEFFFHFNVKNYNEIDINNLSLYKKIKIFRNI